MSEINITKVDDTHFIVDVKSRSDSSHMVTIPSHYSQKLLADSSANVETLLKQSFEFLLAREPNTSILRSFELSVIERYFPEYTSEIKTML